MPHPETLSQALDHFAAHPELAALFGSYDDAPAAPGLVSQYRNLLHHYVHQQGEFADNVRPAHTFWTGCGAIRRQVFLDLGGFDPLLYRRPAIEDIELGYRLTLAGHRIILARNVQVTHLKRWTLRRVFKTDIFQRGVPWTLLMLRTHIAETDLNVSRSQQLCVGSTGLGLLGTLIAPVWPPALLLFVLNLLIQVVLNHRFYRFLAARRGWLFALGSFPLHYLYFCCCGVSVAVALVLKQLPSPHNPRSSTPPPPHLRPREDVESTAVHSPTVSTRRPSRWKRR